MSVLTPALAFIGIAIAPTTIPSIERKNGELRLSLLRRLRASLLLMFDPLTERGVDPGGVRCTKCTTLPFTSAEQPKQKKQKTNEFAMTIVHTTVSTVVTTNQHTVIA